jgi:hypothetical protein
MNVIDIAGPEAALAEMQIRTGEIRLHRPEDFEGMRRAGWTCWFLTSSPAC